MLNENSVTRCVNNIYIYIYIYTYIYIIYIYIHIYMNMIMILNLWRSFSSIFPNESFLAG